MSSDTPRSAGSIRNTLRTTIGGLTILIVLLAGRATWQAWQQLENIRALNAAERLIDRLFVAAETLGAERGVALSLLHAREPDTRAHLRASLMQRRREAELAVRSALDGARALKVPALEEPLAKSEVQVEAVQLLREQIAAADDRGGRLSDSTLTERWFTETTALIRLLEEVWVVLQGGIKEIDLTSASLRRFKYLLRTINEFSSRESALVGQLIAEGRAPVSEEREVLLSWHGSVELSWGLCRSMVRQGNLSSELVELLWDAESHYHTVYDIVREPFYLPGPTPAEPYPIAADFWLELSTQASESLYALRERARDESWQHGQILEAYALRDIGVQLAALLVAAALCGAAFHVIGTRVVAPIHAMIEALLEASRGSADMRAASERGGGDEIARLGEVLRAFRHNAAELRTYADALERSNKELDDFAYIASHDLKEPLRGIHNHSRFLLEDNAGTLDPDSNKRLDRLVYLSQRMERLVDDLLYFSRLGRQELAICSTDLNAVILDLEQTFESSLEECHAQIRVPAPLPTLTCDQTRVTELFRNLIANAIKYNDKPERTVEIGVTERPSPEPGAPACKWIYVRDNGIGIDPEFHEEVFRIFKRLQSNRGAEQEGPGVGLTFVKKIVERHGGQIYLESTPGEGTTFLFTLGDAAWTSTPTW